ncbi:MAG: 3'-5' exoribonuclease YhaM family protein [Sedimentisphaeraceae bacterium JB056]
MSHCFIKDLQPGINFTDTYMVTQPVLRNTTRGDLYIAMFLSDKTGKANCRVWSATEELYNQIPKEGFVQISGKTELYQNNLQIVANQITVVAPENVNVEDYMPKTSKDIPQMYKEVKQIMGGVQHPELKALVEEYFKDSDLMRKFCYAPAAIKMHHNYIGGLLEHTNNMLKVAEKILPLYPQVQGDLVLCGIFLHDMSKTEELVYNLGFSYSNTGQLVGHIVQGAIMLDQKVDMLLDRGIEMKREIVDSLMHILLAHHGKYEFGSPKLPATPEAFMVNYIDDLDAKMNFVEDAIENEKTADDWTGWKQANSQPGTKLFKKKVLEQQ